MALPGPHPIDAGARAAVLALNNAHAVATSTLDAGALDRLLGMAFHARQFGGGTEGFLIALDQSAPYDSPNFQWFRERRAQFVYIDRVVVAPQARGRGLARLLYRTLFTAARQAGHERVVCEVNTDPPNPESDAFHAAMGFAETGRATLPDRGKSVRYLERRICDT